MFLRGKKIFCFQEFTIKYRKAEYYQKDFLKQTLIFD